MRRLALCLTLVLTITITSLSACAPSAPATSTGGTSAPSSDKAIELVASTGASPQFPWYDLLFVEMTTGIEKRSEGRITFRSYHSGQLVGWAEELENLDRGVIDFCPIFLPQYYGKDDIIFTTSKINFLLQDVEHMYRCIDNGWTEIYARHLEEWDVKVVGSLSSELGLADGLFFGKGIRPLRLPTDLVGCKVRAGDALTKVLIDAAGGEGVFMPSSEIYQALMTGLLNCAHTDITTGWTFKYPEYTDGFARLGMGGPVDVPIFNRKTWDSLSPDLQGIVLEVCAQAAKSWRPYPITGYYVEQDFQKIAEAVPQYNIFSPTPEERGEWIKLAERTVWPEYAKLAGADGTQMVAIAAAQR